MRAILIGSAMLLALTACGKKEGTEGSEASPSAAAVKAVDDLKPGEYEIKVDLVKYEAPGMPEAMTKQMKDQMAAQGAQKMCITEANIAEMKANMVKNAAKAGDGCTVENRGTVDNIDSTVTCTSPKATTTVKGTPMNMNVVSEVEMAGQKVNMEMNTSMTRIGDCAA